MPSKHFSEYGVTSTAMFALMGCDVPPHLSYKSIEKAEAKESLIIGLEHEKPKDKVTNVFYGTLDVM